MEKLDLKKKYKAVYKATVKPGFVEVPKLNALMIDGQGDPKNPIFGRRSRRFMACPTP